MRRSIPLFALITLLIGSCPGLAEETPSKPSVEFGSGGEWPEGQSTHVNGKIPDSAYGTWLIVENLDLAKDAQLPALRVYRIQRGANGQPEGEVMQFSMPVEVEKQLGQAQGATLRWEPSEKDLPGLIDAVRKTAQVSKDLRVKSYLDAKDSMPAPVARTDQQLTKIYPNRKPTLFVIRYAAKTPSGDLFSGNYFIEEVQPGMLKGAAQAATVPVSGSGMPIPLNFNGNAKLIRVDQPTAAAPAPAENAKPAS